MYYKVNLFFLLFLLLPYLYAEAASVINRVQIAESDTLENFDDGDVTLLSWADQDINPDSWQLSNSVTYNSSPYSLRLFGNTWKLEIIETMQLDSGDVWGVAAYIQSTAEIQGFGITDSLNTLFYSFAGTEEVDPDEWITVYQGAFPLYNWNNYLLPVADDWLNKFGYLPEIKGIIFINDRDFTSSGIIYFDEICDITNNLPIAPAADIEYTIGDVYVNSKGIQNVDVQFTSLVYDPDSEIFTYFWNFGDDSTSTLADPYHTFLVEDDHDYTVFLRVTDETARYGTASCKIVVDSGVTSFPVTLNFTGDIILARRIQTHINSYGYQSLFDPTSEFLGGSADITIANLESPLTTSSNTHPTKPILLKGLPQHAAALKYGGIDLVTLANNHILDYSLEGLQQTQSAVRSNNIICFGAGADSYEALQPVFYSKSGLNFAFIGNSDRTGQYNNYQPYLNAGINKPGFANLTNYDLIQQINTARISADYVIVQMHSGSEYSTAPVYMYDEAEFYSPYYRAPAETDREIRRFAIDNGADAVICHHPHIIHGFEVYKEKLIAHSLGNFVFDLDYPETYPSMILNAKVNGEGLYNYSVTPVYIDDYVPKKAEGQLGLYILDDLSKKSKDMDTYLRIDRENVTAEIVLDTLSIAPVYNLTEESVTLNNINGQVISDPLPLVRSGSISSVVSINPSGTWQYRLGRQLIWFGNFEDEGCTLWAMDNSDEWYDSTFAYKGERSLCQKRTAGQLPINTNLEERILFYQDSVEYTLHSFIKRENSGAAGVLIQYFIDRTSANVLGSAEITADSLSLNDWHQYTTDFTMPANAEFINLRLRSEPTSSGISLAWFDETGVIEWDNWQEFTPSSLIIYPNDFYWIQIKNTSEILEASLKYEEASFKDYVPSISEYEEYIPLTFTLHQNYPNPFNPSTKIVYDLPSSAYVTLIIYNILGQQVRTLVNELKNQGRHLSGWDGKDNFGQMVTSGVYFYRLEAAGYSSTKKLILLK